MAQQRNAEKRCPQTQTSQHSLYRQAKRCRSSELTLGVVMTWSGTVLAMLPPVSAARSTVTEPGFMLATISSLNRSGAFLPVRQEFCQPMVYSRSNRQHAAHSTVFPAGFVEISAEYTMCSGSWRVRLLMQRRGASPGMSAVLIRMSMSLHCSANSACAMKFRVERWRSCPKTAQDGDVNVVRQRM